MAMAAMIGPTTRKAMALPLMHMAMVPGIDAPMTKFNVRMTRPQILMTRSSLVMTTMRPMAMAMMTRC